MFSIQNLTTLEIRLHKNTRESLDKYGVKKYQELISDDVMLTFCCENNQRHKHKIDVNGYRVCNEILEYRGEAYREEFYKHYETMMSYINLYKYKGKDKDYEKIIKQLGIIIEFIDLNFLYNYLNVVKPVKIPERLKDTFDEQTEIDGVGSRDQTYTKQDYRELIPALCMIKFIYPIMEEIMATKEDGMKNLISSQMLDLLKHYEFFNCNGLVKLRKYVNKIVSSAPAEDVIVKVLSLYLSDDMIPGYYLVEMLFGKMVFLDLLDDNIEIVTGIFNDVSTKLKNKGDVANKFRNNNKPRESEDSTTDKGSVAENFRQGTDVVPGTKIELNYITGDLDLLLAQYNVDFDPEVIKYAKEQVDKLENVDISITHLNLLSCIIPEAIDCRGLNYLEFEPIKNCLILGYAVLMKLNIPSLANLLISKRLVKQENEVIEITMGFEKNKVKGYREDELIKIYPIQKIISERTKSNEQNTEYAIFGWISDMSQEIHSCKWQPPVGVSVADILPPDLKCRIVDMLIDVYNLYYGDK